MGRVGYVAALAEAEMTDKEAAADVLTKARRDIFIGKASGVTVRWW